MIGRDLSLKLLDMTKDNNTLHLDKLPKIKINKYTSGSILQTDPVLISDSKFKKVEVVK